MQKLLEKLRRYALTKGNQEKTDRIIDGSACLHIVYVDAVACLHIHYVDGVACLHIVQVFSVL